MKMLTLALFEFRENIRNKWLLVYVGAFFVFSFLISYFGASNPVQAGASLLNLVLLLVPLFSLVFGSLSFSESLPFCEILVSIPISRRSIFLGKWIGLAAGLSLSFVIGLGLGLLLQIGFSAGGSSLLLLLAVGVLLTWVFVGIAFLIANLARRRELAFVWVLLVWFFFFVLYDVLVIGLVLLFGDYPLEWPMLGMIFLNPIDLARLLVILKMDLAAMMSYSGALFQKYLGTGWGTGLGFLGLTLWIVLPTGLALKRFTKKDL